MKQNQTLSTDCDNKSKFVINRKQIMPTVRQLSKVEDWMGLWIIARQWIMIFLTIFLAQGVLYYFSGSWNLLNGFPQLNIEQQMIVVFVYLAAALVISTRQHALGIIVHDATHYLVFSNRFVNDVVTDLTCAFPIGLSTALYRYQHLEHHKFTNTEKDPYWVQMNASDDWCWPKTKKETITIFVKDIIGLNTLQWGEIISHWSPWPQLFKVAKTTKGKGILTQRERVLFIIFWVSLALLLTFTNSWLSFLILWMLPQITFLNIFVRLRSVAEHLVLENEDELSLSRHVDGTLLERLTISPLNINYHIAHHMFASVPLYNLPKLHKTLLKNEIYRSKAKIMPNYLSLKEGVLSEIIV